MAWVHATGVLTIMKAGKLQARHCFCYPCTRGPMVAIKSSSAPLRISVDSRTGSRHEPATGTHKCPLSATARGGIVLYWSGVRDPSQSVEKSEIPFVSRPATCPNVLHPINTASALIIHDMAFCTSGPTCSTIGFSETRNIPDRSGLQNVPACFSGQSAGIFASRQVGICEREKGTADRNIGASGRRYPVGWSRTIRKVILQLKLSLATSSSLRAPQTTQKFACD